MKRQSDNAFANKWIHNYNECQLSKTPVEPKVNSTFKINENIVSYTFYNVLKKQKYYTQAELVLDMLESSNKIDNTLYQKEHQILSKLLNS